MSAPGQRGAAAFLMALSLVAAVGGFAWAEESTFGPAGAVAAPPGWHGRYVAGIEMLTASPLFLHDANLTLSALHASTVYLYAAYQGQAFFPLPPLAQRDGLTEVAPVLAPDLAALRAEGFRVVLVVSSALLDRATAPTAGQGLLQPGSDVVDPRRAAPLVAALVRTLAAYRPQAIYVGEPFDWPGDRPVPTAAWLAFYRRMRAASGHVPLVMLLPTVHDEYAPPAAAYGPGSLSRALAESGLFRAVGVDAEGMVGRAGVPPAVNRRWERTSPLAFARAARRLGGGGALYEIPITDPYDLGGPPPPVSLVARAVQSAERARVRGIVVFADEYLGLYPPAQQAEIGRLLAAFLSGPRRGSRAPHRPPGRARAEAAPPYPTSAGPPAARGTLLSPSPGTGTWRKAR
ncbi:MAG: hypothetical protein K6V73_08260 [Firmicutes bacterium]|nr:hypothetical protein [Bacillota bacterium]